MSMAALAAMPNQESHTVAVNGCKGRVGPVKYSDRWDRFATQATPQGENVISFQAAIW